MIIKIMPQNVTISTGVGIVREYIDADPYEGTYTIIPSQEEQIIPIINKRATDNITIKPIPQNYGLITWNGATLTVS